MPHDVIMPALGMAQDSGVLVAWLKEPGDPVKAGDGLMEVETDKATMEVEAQVDGYLTDIRVAAGQSAPVGGVVAVIAESPDAAGSGGGGGAANAAETPPADPAPAAKAIDGKPVIMPALGMAQDTGVIVAWAKAVGDAVGADDTLFEVETDKAAMEVPAGTDGYLAAQYAEAGATVPVGDVIALITADKPAEGTPQPAKPGAAPSANSSGEKPAASDTPPAASTAPAETAAPVQPAGPRRDPGARILASPKARRLALERGIDLSRLLDAGVTEPIHVADLDRAPAPAAQLAPVAAPMAVAAPQRASAAVDAAPLAAFLDWVAAETGAAAPRSAILAAFAVGALRAATGDEALAVAISRRPGTQPEHFADPDRVPLTQIAAGEAAPDLHLRDLTSTALTGAQLGVGTLPELTLCAEGDRLRLDYAGTLPPDQALALLDGLAARLADPLRHIL